MKKRIIIELLILTTLWTIFVFLFLFPEAKKYLSTKNSKWEKRFTPSNLKNLKNDIALLKQEKDFLTKKMFPLQETLCKQTAADKIMAAINTQAEKEAIRVTKLDFCKTLNQKLKYQNIYKLDITIQLECSYEKFLTYLELLNNSALFFKIKSINMSHTPNNYTTLTINLNLNTFCI